MKKYVVFARDDAEFVELQNALFSVGIEWVGTLNERQYYAMPCFFEITGGSINNNNGQSFLRAGARLSGGFIAVDAKSVIADPFQIEGANQPEKMVTLSCGRELSESTIIEDIRHYVKD